MTKTTKQTIKLSKEDMRLINVVKAVMDIKNIPDAVSFILQDYAKIKDYSRFIKEKRGKVGKEKK